MSDRVLLGTVGVLVGAGGMFAVVSVLSDDPAPRSSAGVEIRLDERGDDAEELASGEVVLDSSDLELVDADESDGQVVGLRFPDVGLPRGARIDRAWVQFTAEDASADAPAELTIRADLAASAAPFSTERADLSGRRTTDAAVTWSPPMWSTPAASGADERSPDLSEVVQEVVDGPGWTDESTLAVLITGSGQRIATAADASADAAPLLHIEFSGDTAATAVAGTVRFAAVGDYGTGSSDAGDVADMIARQGVDFVVTTGDNSYDDNPIDDNVGQYYSDWIGDYGGSYGSGSEDNRFFPVLGNHDYSDGGGVDAYLDYFTLPGPGVETSGTAPSERYYDVVQGPVHFFALNSNPEEPDGIAADSVQAQWLRSALAASDSDWNVVVFHHPPYSSSENGPTPELRWPFAEWGADAVLLGHEHSYERIEVDGLPYFVTGLGGASQYEQGDVEAGSQKFFNDADGALIVTACPESLLFEFRTAGGEVVDEDSLGSGSCAA